MKRLICFILMTMCITALTSCSKQEYGILFYQENKISAECIVNDKYEVIIIKDGENSSLEIVAPSELKGIKFDFSDGQCHIISDDVKIPVNKEDLKGILSLTGIFSLDEGYITSANIKNEQSVTFEAPLGKYIMSFDERGYPKNAKISDGSYELNVEIKTLKLEKYN